MIDLIVYAICPASFLILGMSAWLVSRRTRHPRIRRITEKSTSLFLGSAAIVWSVYLLGDVLQLLVIIGAILLLVRHLMKPRLRSHTSRFLPRLTMLGKKAA